MEDAYWYLLQYMLATLYLKPTFNLNVRSIFCEMIYWFQTHKLLHWTDRFPGIILVKAHGKYQQLANEICCHISVGRSLWRHRHYSKTAIEYMKIHKALCSPFIRPPPRRFYLCVGYVLVPFYSSVVRCLEKAQYEIAQKRSNTDTLYHTVCHENDTHWGLTSQLSLSVRSSTSSSHNWIIPRDSSTTKFQPLRSCPGELEVIECTSCGERWRKYICT